MKTTLISLLTATLLGFAAQLSGHTLNAADLPSILFAAGLAAWAISQYSFKPAALTVARPFRLPVRLHRENSPANSMQLAA
jgi:hypothetical protein